MNPGTFAASWRRLLAIVEFPGVEQTTQASVAPARLTGISFTMSPAGSVEAFDRLMAEV